MERQQPDKPQQSLNDLKRLRQPKPNWNFKEWKEERFEGKYHAGFVVGITLHPERPNMSAVYFDGGRRRKVEDAEGIVLEGVYVPTSQVLNQNIKVGDLVKSDWHFDSIAKIASLEELEQQGIFTSTPNFDWDKVVGVLI